MKNARPTEVKASALKQRPNNTTAAELLVTVVHGQAWTTSLHVAEKFAKQHENVLHADSLNCIDSHLDHRAADWLGA